MTADNQVDAVQLRSQGDIFLVSDMSEQDHLVAKRLFLQVLRPLVGDFLIRAGSRRC